MFMHCLLYFSNESIPVLNSENIILSVISHNAAGFGLEGKNWSSALATNSDGHTFMGCESLNIKTGLKFSLPLT